MKFPVNLVLAAIVVTTVHAGNSITQESLSSESGRNSAADSSEASDHEASCSFACPAVMRPVTDEDGNTYPNECEMQAAKCKGKKKISRLRHHGKPSGAPYDDNANESARQTESSKEDESDSEEGASSSPSTKINPGGLDKVSSSGDGFAEDTPKSYCPNVRCLAVYLPVTDENGVTYSNACEMQVAKCKGPRESLLDEYKRLYGKEFGASRKSDDRSKPASMEDPEASESDKSAVNSSKGPTKSTKTKTFVSGSDEDGSEGVIDDDTPSMQCATDCPDVRLPVCGSDGIVYSNPCELKLAACQNPELNIVDDDAACTISKVATQDDIASTKSVKFGMPVW